MIIPCTHPLPDGVLRLGGDPSACHVHMSYDVPVSYAYPAGTLIANTITKTDLGPMDLTAEQYIVYAPGAVGGGAITPVVVTVSAFLAVSLDPAVLAIVLATIDGRQQILPPPAVPFQLTPDGTTIIGGDGGLLTVPQSPWTDYDENAAYVPGNVVRYGHKFFLNVGAVSAGGSTGPGDHEHYPPDSFFNGLYGYWYPYDRPNFSSRRMEGWTTLSTAMAASLGGAAGANITAGDHYTYYLVGYDPYFTLGVGSILGNLLDGTSSIRGSVAVVQGGTAQAVTLTWANASLDQEAPPSWMIFRGPGDLGDYTAPIYLLGVTGNSFRADNRNTFVDDGSIVPDSGYPLNPSSDPLTATQTVFSDHVLDMRDGAGLFGIVYCSGLAVYGPHVAGVAHYPGTGGFYDLRSPARITMLEDPGLTVVLPDATTIPSAPTEDGLILTIKNGAGASGTSVASPDGSDIDGNTSPWADPDLAEAFGCATYFRSGGIWYRLR